MVPADLSAASEANGRFAVDLYRRLAEFESGKDLFLSPFSISLALTMVAEGAVDQTLDQMLDVLHVAQGDLARIHSGQRGLQQSATPVVAPEVTQKIALLRLRLKETNDRTKELDEDGSYQETMTSAAAGRKIADELNGLLRQTVAYELQIANALWLERSYPIQPSFISALTLNYGTSVFPVDFKLQPDSTRRQINQWVASQTHDRIQNLLSPESITELTSLVITNAVYFKGDWAKPFERSNTRPGRFFLADQRSKEIAMMQQWNGDSASYAAFDSNGDLFPTPQQIDFDMKDNDPSLYPDANGHTMLSLDYQGHKLQMIVLVPQSATGLADLERSLTYDKLQRWIEQLQLRTVNVTLPKFKLEATYPLETVLKSLGMVRAFQEPEANHEGAQFGKLTASQRLDEQVYISQVVHKTFVEVNEIGTEAAAATVVCVFAGSAMSVRKTRPFNPVFRADKPFLFLIRDRETANILFLGRYLGPKGN